LAGGKAGDRKTHDRRFGAAGQHHVGITERDQPGGIADGVSTGGTRRHNGVIRPLQSMPDRNLAGYEVDDVCRNEERADAPRTLFLQDQRTFGDPLDAANARAEHDAGGAAFVLGLGFPAGIGQGLVGRSYSVGNEVRDLASFARFEERIGIERAFAFTGDDTGNFAGQVIDIEMFNAPGPGLAFEKTLPAQLGPKAERREETHACDDDASHLWNVSPYTLDCVSPKKSGRSLID